MKTILVAVDFSEASINAARYANLMADSIQAGVLLLHVNVPQESFNQAPVVERAQSALDTANTGLSQIKEELVMRTEGRVPVNFELRVGEFFTEMDQLCNQIDPYLVIMGSQGTTGAELFLMGSNSIHAMRNLNRPLLTVPLGADYKPIRKIGLGSDLNKTMETLPLEKVEEFLNDFNASLHIIYVGKYQEMSAENVFESVALQEKLQSLHPAFHIVSQSHVDEGLIEFTEVNGIDILIIFPRQYGFIDQIFHRSVSKQMILRSKVPVMVLHTEPIEE